MRVLFVCTGNTCRSPMAEALLRHHGQDVFEVKSAGVYAAHGSDASAHAKEALSEKGISIEHQASQLQEEQLLWADIVLTMTEGHKQTILHYFPEIKEKVSTLFEAASGTRGDISDPFGGSLRTYQQTRDELENLILNFIKKHSNR
ncbi:low molecular weight protein arginine phosphatase [Ectobacillus antri]|jgi:protein-tyrosine-phosphatase|uniref:Low molecular weight protein arginine phosphatase n=1 Tax=Ectobacillus antri TaxID=2486280 RepID=A0ABT6H9R0_9BACI|nr:low molecular weight protein arginine phosphatase [Ectobacillus antri]MDG4658497.1 low molecular weight protein arginine phosphatase [Ectobacillus antri]MDG5755633.1 low molecular weight protein arginine phosphatase [Ectobacillus antri]